ncbi:nmrA-family protein [Dentipellis sp. KUC8613]|nr:nmrA-family protein [Dentipellis sp. KUC8613]
MSTSEKKLILVIGATGAQGMKVIEALLRPSESGAPSPWAVRALTRNVAGNRAQALAKRGVEVVQGSFLDFDAVLAAMKGVYGAFVNTDGFTVGEQREIYAAMRIFESAKQTGTLKHFIWSGGPYSLKLGGYDPKYKVDHNDAKGRVADFIRVQPSGTGEGEMAWTILTFGIYMDMLKFVLIGPQNTRPDGTRVFFNPLGADPVALIALDDLAWWVRYSFEHIDKAAGQDFTIASDEVSFPTFVKQFTAVTGKPAVHIQPTPEGWFDIVVDPDRPLAGMNRAGDGTTTVRQNFTAWWHWWHDSAKLWPVDMQWVRSVHPGTLSVEDWMRKIHWDGSLDLATLKSGEVGEGRFEFDMDKVRAL